MKALRSGALAAAGAVAGTMLPAAVARAWMAAANSALVLAMLRMRAYLEHSVEILRSLQG